MADHDTVTITEAARILGTTNERIARLIKRGILSSRESVQDRRRRLIPRAQVEQILQDEGWRPPKRRSWSDGNAGRPRPRTIGMYKGPMPVTASEVDIYLAEHWKP